MPMVKVAACQIDPQLGEVDRNLERIERWVVDAAQAGASLVVLPEAATTGYAFTSLDEALPVARRAGVVAPRLPAGMPAKLAIAIVCGTVGAEGAEILRSAVVIWRDGRRFK